MTNLRKSMILYIVLFMAVMLHPLGAMAASGSVSVGVSSSTVSEGDTVSVTVSISADEAIGYGVAISYDSGVLEYTGGADGGGGGTVTLVSEGDGSSSSFSRTISFKAISNGSSSIAASSYAGGLFGYSSGDISTSYGSSSVTVAEPVTEAPTTAAVTEQTTQATEVSTEGTETEQTTEASTEETTEDVGSPVAVIDGKEYFFVPDKEVEGIPETYKVVDIGYKEWTVTAFESPSKQLLLVCLSDSDNNKGIYIYDREKDTFTPYREYMANENKYVILAFPDDMEVADGFKKATLKLDNEKLDAYILEGTKVFLIYAMNINGDAGLYLYDASEKTFMAYMGDVLLAAQKQEEEAVTEATLTDAVPDITHTDAEQSDKDMLLYCLIGAGILLLIFLIIIIALAVKNGKQKKEINEIEKDLEFLSKENSAKKNDVEENKNSGRKNMEEAVETEKEKENKETEINSVQGEKTETDAEKDNITVPEIALPIIKKPKEVKTENNENKIDG
ncbi:MAG: hypothetical protein NC225_01215 [Clostridium sp.]|nr:hypothetical protein [Clostridium sp.]MCM1398081.1 hypothetical protein [Clostridium sp.]MCM1459284.1 hypothetical protein [Bacteroides sp.]